MKKNSNWEDVFRKVEIFSAQQEIERIASKYCQVKVTGKGDPFACLSRLTNAFRDKYILDVYRDGEIETGKMSAYLAGKIWQLLANSRPFEQARANYKTMLHPILSDCESLIHWHAQYMLPYLYSVNGQLPSDKTNQFEYLSLLIKLALQEEWSLLEAYSKALLDKPPAKHKTWVMDARFFLGLVQGDKRAMVEAIEGFVKGPNAYHRNNEYVFEPNFFSPWALLYAKLAWRFGHEIELDSPLFPQDLVPVKELPSYDEPYDFLREFDMFKPLDAEGPRGELARKLSPRPPGEPMLTYSELKESVEIVKGEVRLRKY